MLVRVTVVVVVEAGTQQQVVVVVVVVVTISGATHAQHQATHTERPAVSYSGRDNIQYYF